MSRAIAGLWPLTLAGCLACCHARSVAGSAIRTAAGDGGTSGSNGDEGGAAGSSANGTASSADAGRGDVANGDATAGAAGTMAGSVHALFNGVDFENWDRYLGKPSDDEPPLGLENDPDGVYSVVSVDGEPAIRVSGQDWGSLISKKEYCDFQLRAQYKWGSQLWPPLSSQDSGIMILSTGPLGAVNAGGNALSDPIGSGGFMVSLEYQIAPGAVGGLYNLGPITFSTSRVAGQESPGTWNQVEIIHQDGVVITLLNGEQVTQASDFRLDWPGQAETVLSCGKLQLQSEGAEIFFRHVEIETLP